MEEFYYLREVAVAGELQQQFVVFEKTKSGWESRIISKRVGQPFISPDNQTMYLGKRYKQRTENGWPDIKLLSEAFQDYRIMRMTASATGTLVFDEATKKAMGCCVIQ